ncbi:kelch repeat-containing protein [Prolixibacter sp. NT017]|uniref:Kelch repeat-containing protein n=1 Tax=Prolixibacter sp. NT017 TaxID=2652390 RepID=UPI001299030A|nr:kelch repeat-containing protein [Prolixibacter sp. NT017]
MRKKKFVWYFAFLVIASGTLVSCGNSSDSELIGNSVKLSDFEGVSRSDAVGFTIGDRGYVGTGYDGTDRLTDFWAYDPAKNTWIQCADFPGEGRNGAVGFAVGDKGYVGTGYDGIEKLKDFYQYDPSTNTWTQKADFPGTARYGAIGFGIDSLGYLGTGYDGNYLKDMYAYNPTTDTWKHVTSVGGSKRRDAVAFVINGKAYVGTGVDNGIYEDDFWEYDPATDTWTEKNRLSDATAQSFDDDYAMTGSNRVAFAIGDRGFVATGGQGVAGTDIWEYNSSTDLWEQIHDFEGSGRTEAVGFAIGNVGYITTGRSSSYYFDDLWGIHPDDTYNEYD